MPFIDSKVTVTMNENQKETIKSRLGKAIQIFPGKTEEWLMVGFQDNYCLYLGGNRDSEAAFVNVSLLGKQISETYELMTAEICSIFAEELAIPMERIYVKYEEVDYWGCNGKNF